MTSCLREINDSNEEHGGQIKNSAEREKRTIRIYLPLLILQYLFSHINNLLAKRREKSRAKCYRDKIKLQEQLRKERKKKMMYMKRWLREKEKSTKCSVESPHSRSTKMLRGVKFNFQSKKKRNTVRRSFEFNFVLNRSVKAKVQERKPTAKTHIVKCSFVQHCS